MPTVSVIQPPLITPIGFPHQKNYFFSQLAVPDLRAPRTQIITVSLIRLTDDFPNNCSRKVLNLA
ncbi:MAG: hypothetical protein CML40_00010 [Rhodobacteraceae bacterium]|nr:MAG: hypothetical protein CML40_00010 [Paracoccaceae bacterium]